MILSGDIGGSNCRLALFDSLRGGLDEPIKFETFKSQDYPSLSSIVKEFLGDDTGKLVSACFGVPGPVTKGKVNTTNLPWFICQEELENKLNCPKVVLINDLVGVAYSLPYLKESQVQCIYKGSDERELKTFTVIAPGTGLGQAGISIFNDDYVPLPSEGGHIDFAPITETHSKLLKYLKEKLGKRISVERVCSGQGIRNIMDFLINCEGASTIKEVHENIDSNSVSKIIGEAAVNNKDKACVTAIELFIEILASHAGSTVLSFCSNGGIYIGGGIPPKLTKFFESERFKEFYLNKGRLSSKVASVPVFLIKDDLAGLQGTSRLALRAAEEVARERRLEKIT